MLTKLRIHIEYLTYLFKHKYYVYSEGRKLGLGIYRLLVHDLSKFLPSEWFGYAEWKYKQMTEEGGGTNKNDRGYGRSWHLHYLRNAHHWQHFCYTDDRTGKTYPVQMPDSCRKEMLADWRATQRIRFGDNNVLPYYETNREVIQLHGNTVAWLAEQIGYTGPTWEVYKGHDLFRDISVKMYTNKNGDPIYRLVINTADGDEEPIDFESERELCNYLRDYLFRVTGYLKGYQNV